MLRMSKTEEDKTTFYLEGKLVGSWVNELLQECYKALAQNSEIILDLEKVSYADEEGICALATLRKENIKLTNCSLFLSVLLATRS